jgi:hypothetical protein
MKEVQSPSDKHERALLLTGCNTRVSHRCSCDNLKYWHCAAKYFADIILNRIFLCLLML